MSQPGAELRATYRLQLTPDFAFADARALVPYLRDLGISHLYLSPSFQARPGSTHGYDVIDPSKLSDALGGEEEFEALSQAARNAGMGIVLDVVPNHMAADDANVYWKVPELRGRFFDIDPIAHVYRRFFDIGELAGLRQIDLEVFETTHELALRLVRDGVIDGLRIDHPDGLGDPYGYFKRLRDRGAERVWIEKILSASHPPEHLRDWPVSGTVGYEFLNDVCALFVDPDGEAPLTELWERVSGDRRSFGAIAAEAKLEQVHGPFWPDVERLARELGDEEVPGGIEALGHALASLPVYRTYIDPGYGQVTEEDRAAIEAAHMHPEIARDSVARARGARRVRPPLPADLAGDHGQGRRGHRVLPLQPIACAQRRRRRSLALRDPDRGLSRRQSRAVRALSDEPADDPDPRRQALRRCARADRHCSRRSPDEWASHVDRWLEVTDSLRDGGAPDDAERYFIFQTLLGAWPIESERIDAYIEKALREAKRNTNWVEQNHDWEDAVRRFCAALYSCRAFLEDFEPFADARRDRCPADHPRPAGVEADRAGNPGHLPGRRAAVPGARRPRQPPARRLGLAPGDAQPPDGRLPPRPRHRQAVRDDAVARAARATAASRSRGRIDRSTPASAYAPSCGATTCSSLSPCARARPASGSKPSAGAGETCSAVRSRRSTARSRSAASCAHIRWRCSSACNDRVRVLLISWEYPPVIEGGLGRHVRKLSEHLVRDGIEVHVLTRGGRRLDAAEERHGVLVHRVREPPFPTEDIDAFVRWAEAMNGDMRELAFELGARCKFDLVHSHDWLVAGAAESAARRLRRPWLVTVHATEFGRHQGRVHDHPQSHIHAAERRMLRRADHVITCSRYMKRHLEGVFGVPPAKIDVIPNGIDPRRSRAGRHDRPRRAAPALRLT